MKKFDLEAAKKGAPVCTRDGRKARIVCFDVQDGVYQILALITYPSGEDSMFYTNQGKTDTASNDDDLMMADIPTIHHEGWVNIRYNVDGRDMTDCYIYHSKEAALCYCSDVHHTVKISWEDEV